MTTKPGELLLRQHGHHAYKTSVLRAILVAFLRNLQSQLWVAVVKYALQKSVSFARVRVTTLAAPLLQAYQGGFFYV